MATKTFIRAKMEEGRELLLQGRLFFSVSLVVCIFIIIIIVINFRNTFFIGSVLNLCNGDGSWRAKSSFNDLIFQSHTNEDILCSYYLSS